MARFLAGLLCGAMIVGASWYGNRLGYEQAKVDVAAAQKLASQLHEREREAAPDRRDDSIWARQTNPDEDFGSGDCMLATLPARPCVGTSPPKPSPRMDKHRRLGSSREFRRDDTGGPWVDLPTPEISPTERAKLVADLQARGALTRK
ncbi:MAG: hypothetical protein HYZ29_11015 [Myxococcales bacterium]|nr:hypothetical protein [Myxococcales bacterium]